MLLLCFAVGCQGTRAPDTEAVVKSVAPAQLGALREAVSSRPDDLEARRELTSALLDQDAFDEARGVVLPLLRGDVRRSNPEAFETGALELARIIDAQGEHLLEAGRAALERNAYNEAIAQFDALIELRLQSPLLDDQDLSMTLDPPLREFMLNVENVLFDKAIASKAFAQWRSGAVQAAEQTLTDRGLAQVDAADRDSQRRLAYSQMLAEYAALSFERNDWSEAAFSYNHARTQRLQSNPNTFDDEAARQQFNQALAEANLSRLSIAQRLLADLAQRRPDYQPDLVQSTLGQMRDSNPNPG